MRISKNRDEHYLNESVSATQIERFIVASVKGLLNDDATNYRFKLDNRLAVFVGWSSDIDTVIMEEPLRDPSHPDYGIVAGIKVWTSDSMWTDYDFLAYPHYTNKDNEPVDYVYSVTSGDAQEAKELAKLLITGYHVLEHLDISESGEIIEEEKYDIIDSKTIHDTDGFTTDYTWYRRIEDGMNIMIYGDSDTYNPDNCNPDWESESDSEAAEWFDSFEGFTEEEMDAKFPINDSLEKCVDCADNTLEEGYLDLDDETKTYPYNEQPVYRIISNKLINNRSILYVIGKGKKLDGVNSFEPIVRSGRYTTEESFLFVNEEAAKKFLEQFKRSYPDADLEGLHVSEYNPIYPIYKLIIIDSPCGRAYFGLQRIPKKKIDDQKQREAEREAKKEKEAKNESYFDDNDDAYTAKIAKATIIKDWYKKAYPSDDLGDELIDGYSFYDLFEDLDAYTFDYRCCANDSIVRERVFDKLAKIIKADYNYIYDQWLRCKNDTSKKIHESMTEELGTSFISAASLKREMLSALRSNGSVPDDIIDERKISAIAEIIEKAHVSGVFSVSSEDVKVDISEGYITQRMIITFSGKSRDTAFRIILNGGAMFNGNNTNAFDYLSSEEINKQGLNLTVADEPFDNEINSQSTIDKLYAYLQKQPAYAGMSKEEAIKAFQAMRAKGTQNIYIIFGPLGNEDIPFGNGVDETIYRTITAGPESMAKNFPEDYRKYILKLPNIYAKYDNCVELMTAAIDELVETDVNTSPEDNETPYEVEDSRQVGYNCYYRDENEFKSVDRIADIYKEAANIYELGEETGANRELSFGKDSFEVMFAHKFNNNTPYEEYVARFKAEAPKRY